MRRIVDLRSDTVTKPTPAMREAMYRAEVGDDVYQEDPTVLALEELGARMTGKEAGLFVTSGTMGNQVAVMTHCERGSEVICEVESHLYYYEVGGMAVLSGVQARTLKGVNGLLDPDEVAAAIRPADIHVPRTSLISIENTHNRAGGTCYSLSHLATLRQVADAHGIPIHMDGARLFNAAVALKVSPREIARHADTVMVCLSKGLGAPVGSLLLGPKDWIARARKNRKMLGGGMRQAGLIAAAGIVALKDMVDRLEEDHKHARRLAEALAATGRINIDLATVQTNIVILDVSPLGMDAGQFIAKIGEFGIKANRFGPYKLRFVTHYGVTGEDIDYTIDVITKLCHGGSAAVAGGACRPYS